MADPPVARGRVLPPGPKLDPAFAPSGVLPPRDQKAYDLGAQSAREVIDNLRAKVAADREVIHLLGRAIDEICADRDQDLDTIRNQNSHMAWLEGQLQEGAARERAYVEAINDLCDEVVRIHAKAKAVLEGRPHAEQAERSGADVVARASCTTERWQF